MGNKTIVKKNEFLKLRYIRGMTLAEVSLKTGLSSNAICMIEQGKISPSPKTFKKLCEFYEVDSRSVLA